MMSNPVNFWLITILAMTVNASAKRFGKQRDVNAPLSVKAVELKDGWKFHPAENESGLRENYYNPKFDASAWKEVTIDEDGWDGQGFPNHTGYGWYRLELRIPKDFIDSARLFLFFRGVDEDAEVYLNGQKIFTHDGESLGMGDAATYDRPFDVDITGHVKKAGENLLAVRVFNRYKRGGIYEPVFLVATKKPATSKELCAAMVANSKVPRAIYEKWYFELPPLPPHPQEDLFGSRIQRTMTLLETSTSKRPREVRILFYGQSIVQGSWWHSIVQRLRKRYPHAKIVADNRAIGGFTAPHLVRPATHDIRSFHPDLVVFHVYDGGLTGELERIISNIRRDTTAEIMLFTHTLHWKEEWRGKSLEEIEPLAQVGSSHIRYLAQKYNCELVDVRQEWINYLKTYDLGPNELMGDTIHTNVHPNPMGHALLMEMIYRHFKFNALFPGGWYDMVRTYEARRPIEESDDEITFTGAPWRVDARIGGVIGSSPKSAMTLSFMGDRVDVVHFSLANPGTAKILIDGRKPSSFPELYVANRPGEVIKGKLWPVPRRVTLGGNPTLEDWTLTVTDISEKGRDVTFKFDVKGSVTGPDGNGDSETRFVSNSGKIIIDPSDFTTFEMGFRKKKIKPGFVTTWKVIPQFIDVWKPEPVSAPALEGRTILVHGLANEEHTIEIIPNGDGPIPIKELVVYKPPLR